MTTETLTAPTRCSASARRKRRCRSTRCRCSGELPAWLGGTLVRVTPALLEPADHWFDGLAMLNAFGIGDGRVSYGSRFLESREYRHVREHGQVRRPWLRHRPLPLDLPAHVLALRPGHDRQLQRQRHPPRRALDRDDRDADRDRVRPGDARDDRPARVDAQHGVTRAPTRATTSSAASWSATSCASGRAAATSSTRSRTAPPSGARSRRCRSASRPTCTRSR